VDRRNNGSGRQPKPLDQDEAGRIRYSRFRGLRPAKFEVKSKVGSRRLELTASKLICMEERIDAPNK